MKRHFLIVGILATLTCFQLLAADNPVDNAVRQEVEDNFKRLNTRIEDMQAMIHSQRKNFESLQKEVSNLQEELARLVRNNAGSATDESLKNLAKSIEEVDKKRQADNERTVAALDQIARSVGNRAMGSVKTNQPPTTIQRSGNEKGFEWSIRKGDTLLAIVSALGKHGIKVTKRQIEEANPGVNWDRLKIGQKIFVPDTTQR